jgi:hypothetical protein
MTSVAPREDSDHIRGMMPTFVGWQDARASLALENEAARRRHEYEQRRGASKRSGASTRWLWVIGFAAIAAVAIFVVTGGQPNGAAPTANTPVDELPWRMVETPSGGLRVDLPYQPGAAEISGVAGTGQQLQTAVSGFEITVAEFTHSLGPNEARSMVAPLFRERADLLNGHDDGIKAVRSRVGQAFEGMVLASGPVGIVHVVVDGSSLYLLEIRGAVGTLRAQQIFERVVQGFTPTRTR